MSLFGPHIIDLSRPGAADLLRLAGPALGGMLAVNTTDSLDLAAANGVPLRIFRDTATDAMDPGDAANHLLDHDWRNATHLQLACESSRSNDPLWQIETIRALRGKGWTRGVVGGAWSTGWPPDYDTTTHRDGSPHFPVVVGFAAVYALVDYFAVHGYVGCLPGSPLWADAVKWYACRPRMYSHCLRQHGIAPPRWLASEGGIDRFQGRTAIGRAGVTTDQYVGLVRELAGEDAKDGTIRLYFTLGPTPDWQPFDYADAVPALATLAKQEGPHMPDYAQAVWSPSPNFWAGRDGMQPTAIVLHGTAGAGAVSWFANPASQVSAHYVVDTDGSVAQCVAEADTAWANGIVGVGGVYPASPNPNYFTLSIEHVRDITNTSPLTAAQLASSLSLTADMLRRHPSVATIIGHDSIQPGRVCPGPGFPLSQFQALLKGAGNVDDLYEMQWKSYKQDTAVNTSAAIYKDWLAKRQAGDHSYGVPTTQEFPHGAGVAQLFTGGLATWDAANGVRWF